MTDPSLGTASDETSLVRLRDIVAKLRAPDGCPWDREQTHASIRGALVEECYEVIDAIESNDDANLREELGDMLLHVVMHAQMAAERDAFSLDDVIAGISEKLVRRHPHVFGDSTASDTNEVLSQWEEIKKAEKGGSTSIADGVPRSLPAAMRAEKAQKKARRAGYDWTDVRDVIAKAREELDELEQAIAEGDSGRIEAESGDILFAAVNVVRFLKIEPEMVLNESTNRFLARVRLAETFARSDGRELKDCSPAELDVYWERAKATLDP
jgi:tetrapyrrole methylase family protein/MazG family protein